MSLNIANTAEDLFEKIRSRFEKISIGDEKANNTQDPSLARFFNFDFVSKDGTNFGNIHISLIDEKSLKIYFSKTITEKLDDLQKNEWYDFLRSVRMFAKRHMLAFDTRDISRSSLDIKDVKQQAVSDSLYQKNDVSESYNFKGGFPFDVDHMPGAVIRDSKSWFSEYIEWDMAIDALNARKYDDECEYISRSTEKLLVTPDGKVVAKWDEKSGKGYIAESAMTTKAVSGAPLRPLSMDAPKKKYPAIGTLAWEKLPDHTKRMLLKKRGHIDHPLLKNVNEAGTPIGFSALLARGNHGAVHPNWQHSGIYPSDRADEELIRYYLHFPEMFSKTYLERNFSGSIEKAKAAARKFGFEADPNGNLSYPVKSLANLKIELPRLKLLFGEEPVKINVEKVAESISRTPPSHTIEAYGIKGMKRLPWRKSFKNYEQLADWCEKFDAEVYGTRDLEQAKRGNLSPAIPESAEKSELDKQIEFHQQGLANAQYKGPMATMHRKKLRALLSQQRAQTNTTESHDPALPLDVPPFIPYGNEPVGEAKTPNARYEMYFGGNKIERFFAPSRTEAIKRAKARGAISVVRVSQYGKPIGGPVRLRESKIYGINRQQSAQDVARKNARIIIKHSKPVMDEVRGARSRAIESIFIENTAGERFKVPSNSLAEARALARHVAEGGNIYDDFGEHITELCHECSTLREFMRGTRGKEFVDETADDIVSSAAKHYLHTQKLVNSLKGRNGYSEYKATWESRGVEPDSFEEFDPAELRHKFRQEKVDPRIDRTVETAYKVYKRQVGSNDTAELTEFAQHMDQVEEGTWSLPEGDHDYDNLVELFKEPLPVGVDAMNAIGALYHLIGDDALFDMLGAMAQDDSEQDCRQAILYWLRDHMPKVHRLLAQKLSQPKQEEPSEQPAKQESIEEASDDAIQKIKELSGMK